MDEFTGDPAVRILPHRHFILEDRLTPARVFSKMDQLVIGVDQGNTGAEIRDEEKVAATIDIGGKDEIRHRAPMFTLKIEPLEPRIGTVSDND